MGLVLEFDALVARQGFKRNSDLRTERSIAKAFNRIGSYCGPPIERGMESIVAHLDSQVEAQHNITQDGHETILTFPDGDKGKKAKFVYTAATDQHPATVSISTQFGCTYACSFCASAQNKWLGHLASEQLAYAIHKTLEVANPSVPQDQPIRIECTGEGDPGAAASNISELAQHLKDVDPRIESIMVSTAGSVKGIRTFTESVGAVQETGVALELQISMHHPDQQERKKLITTGNPIGKLLEAGQEFSEASGHPVRLNYAVGDVNWNATEQQAQRIAKIVDPNSFYLNVVPVNGGDSIPTSDQLKYFVELVQQHSSDLRVDMPTAPSLLNCGTIAPEERRAELTALEV